MAFPGDGARRCKVMIATPDRAEQERLVRAVEALPEFHVVARTTSLMETYAEVEDKEPGAVLIAAALAIQPEFEVMRALFSTLDVRWLMVSPTRPEAARIAGQPRGSDLFSVPADAGPQAIATQLRSLTRSATTPWQQSSQQGPKQAPQQTQTGSRPPGNAPPPDARRPDRVVLIGASTGGVEALLSVLSSFPADCPPTLIVQHTGSGFGESLATLLDRHVAPKVRPARDGLHLERGQVLVGAGTRAHVMLAQPAAAAVLIRSGEPVSGHCPSVDVLFRSAEGLGGRAVAALLTGMGRDGAEGMLALRRTGAHTIAQDAATSVVYGMPKAAADIGAAAQILPLDRIGPALLAAATRSALSEART